MKAKELPLGSAARGKTRRVIPPARYLETNTFAPLRTESAKPDFTTSAKCSISGRECVPLCRVNDNAHCVTQPRADAADAVAKVYAIVVLGALHRTIVDSKSASVRMNRSQSDEKLKPVWACLEPSFDGTAETVPARQHQAALRPAEDPRDRAQILDPRRSSPRRRTAADVEIGNLADYCRLAEEAVEAVGFVDEAAIGAIGLGREAISMPSSGIRSKMSRCQHLIGRDHPLPGWPTFPPGRLSACCRATRSSRCWRSTSVT